MQEVFNSLCLLTAEAFGQWQHGLTCGLYFVSTWYDLGPERQFLVSLIAEREGTGLYKHLQRWGALGEQDTISMVGTIGCQCV
jgi:hypothetical protein